MSEPEDFTVRLVIPDVTMTRSDVRSPVTFKLDSLLHAAFFVGAGLTGGAISAIGITAAAVKVVHFIEHML